MKMTELPSGTRVRVGTITDNTMSGRVATITGVETTNDRGTLYIVEIEGMKLWLWSGDIAHVFEPDPILRDILRNQYLILEALQPFHPGMTARLMELEERYDDIEGFKS